MATRSNYIRNGDLDARNFFSTTGPDTLKRNTYGGRPAAELSETSCSFRERFQGTENRQNPPQLTTAHPDRGHAGGRLFSTIRSATCQSNGKALTLKKIRPAGHFPGKPDSGVLDGSGSLGAGVEISPDGSSQPVRAW